MASAGFEPTNLGTKGQHAHLQPTKAAKMRHIIKFNLIGDILLCYINTVLQLSVNKNNKYHKK